MSWKRRVKRAVAPIAAAMPSAPRGVWGIVLCYHAVAPRAAPEVVSASMFARQVDLLASRYRVVPLDDLARRVGEGARDGMVVALTFDDGYRNVLEHALPVLRERRLPATAFILPGLWGEVASWPSAAPEEARRLWNVDDASAWIEAGMTIGSHGMHHVDLTTATPERIRAEVAGSKAALEEALGLVAAFCYPWGRHRGPAREEVRRAGYAYAVAGGYGRSHRPGEVFALRRLTVDHDDTMRNFELKLRGGYDWLDALGRARERTRAWR